jgi:hypothetical protein
LVEFNGTEEIAVIGHGDGGHAEFGDTVHEFSNSHSAIQ